MLPAKKFQISSKFLACLTLAVCFALLVAPNFFGVSTASEAGELQYYETILFGFCFWIFWFTLFKKITWGLVLALIPGLWWFVSLQLRIDYLTPISSTYLGMFADTDARELLEFLSVFGSSWLLASLLFLCFLLLGAYFANKAQLTWRHSSRKWALLLMPIVGLLMLWQFNQSGVESSKSPEKVSLLAQVETRWQWLDKWTAVYPFDLFFAAHELWHETERLKYAMTELEKNQKFEVKLHQEKSISKIIWVIGESANASRWQLYGFDKPTTPELAKRNDLIVFQNMVSASIATRNAVPLMLSKTPLLKSSINGENLSNTHATPSVIRQFVAGGFETHWLSNQSSNDKLDTPLKLYSAQTKHRKMFNPVEFRQKGSHDEVMIPSLKEALAKQGAQMVVMHTLGSHFNYSHRYPAEFDFFKPSLKPEDKTDRMERTPEVIALQSNAYDNATRYTDYVLAQIIHHLHNEKEPALLLYMSDHGEDVDPPNCKDKGYHRKSKDSYRVPAFVFANAAAWQKNRPALERMKARAQWPLMSSVGMDLLLDAAGIEMLSPQSETAGWATELFKPTTRFVGVDFGKRVNFDQAVKTSPCDIVGGK